MTTGEIIKTEEGETTLFKYSCKYNEGVGCAPLHRNCERCGWNPKVAQERLEKICKEQGLYLPPEYRKEK